MMRQIIFDSIVAERLRQDKIHPPFKDNFEAMVVLTEEVGELAQAIYDRRVNIETDDLHIVEETIQVMAVCMKFLETLIN